MRRIAVLLILLAGVLAAADKDLAGTYTGEYKSAVRGGGGPIQVTLTQSSGGWKSEVKFSVDGSPVAAQVRSTALQDGKLEVVYGCEIGGSELRVKLTAKWSGSEFAGAYECVTAEGSEVVDSGTWSAKKGS